MLTNLGKQSLSYTNYSTRNLPFLVSYFVDLARYRHLAWSLVGSDLRARFRRSYLGILWAVLQPLGFSLIVALVWSQVFKTQSIETFIIYVFSGMLIWEYFSQSVIVSLDSLINSAGYLKQARIPFLVFQMRVPLSALVVLMFGMIGLFGMMAAVGHLPPLGFHLLLLPVYFLMLVTFMIPMSVIASIVGPSFRDSKHVIGLLLQAVFFVSPVMLERGVLNNEAIAFIKYLNPLVPLLDLFRDPMLYGKLWQAHDVLVWLGWTAGLWIVAVLAAARAGRSIIFAL